MWHIPFGTTRSVPTCNSKGGLNTCRGVPRQQYLWDSPDTCCSCDRGGGRNRGSYIEVDQDSDRWWKISEQRPTNLTKDLPGALRRLSWKSIRKTFQASPPRQKRWPWDSGKVVWASFCIYQVRGVRLDHITVPITATLIYNSWTAPANEFWARYRFKFLRDAERDPLKFVQFYVLQNFSWNVKNPISRLFPYLSFYIHCKCSNSDASRSWILQLRCSIDQNVSTPVSSIWYLNSW